MQCDKKMSSKGDAGDAKSPKYLFEQTLWSKSEHSNFVVPMRGNG